MPFSLRLDPETEAKVRRLAAASGRSKSAVVREAMAEYAVPATPGTRSGPVSAFDQLKPFIGKVRTGGRQLSQNTHAKYRAALRRKHRARRPR